jgi:hypothetical protein
MRATCSVIPAVFWSRFIIALLDRAPRFTSQEKNIGNSVLNAPRMTPIRRAMYPTKFAGLYFLLLLCAVVVVGIDTRAVRAFDAVARPPAHPWCVTHGRSAVPTACKYDNFLTCGMAAIVAGGSCKGRLRSSIAEGAVPVPRPRKLSAAKRSKSIRQNDAQSAPQRLQGSTAQVDGSTDAVAASPPAAAKPIEQSDAASVKQQPQESTLSKPTDAVAASTSVAAKPEQSDAASVTQQPQESTLSKPTDAVAASPPAVATLRVADANSSPPHADPEALYGGGRITERSYIARGLSFKPVQMFLLLVLGVAIVVFLISLVIILHHRVTAFSDLQLGHDRPEPQAQHGLPDDSARRSQMFVGDQRNQVRIDALPGRTRPSATRPQSRVAISTEPPPKSSLDEVKVALEDFRAELIYVDRTQKSRWGDAIQNGSRQTPSE